MTHFRWTSRVANVMKTTLIKMPGSTMTLPTMGFARTHARVVRAMLVSRVFCYMLQDAEPPLDRKEGIRTWTAAHPCRGHHGDHTCRKKGQPLTDFKHHRKLLVLGHWDNLWPGLSLSAGTEELLWSRWICVELSDECSSYLPTALANHISNHVSNHGKTL